MFAKEGENNSVWVSLLEKAYAKVNANYENLSWGF